LPDFRELSRKKIGIPSPVLPFVPSTFYHLRAAGARRVFGPAFFKRLAGFLKGQRPFSGIFKGKALEL